MPYVLRERERHSRQRFKSSSCKLPSQRFWAFRSLHVQVYIYIYIYISNSLRDELPPCLSLQASRFQVCFVSGAVRCVHFTSILESLGCHFGGLGLYFSNFGSSGAGLWTPLGALGRWGQILKRFREKSYHHLDVILAPQISQVVNKHEKTVSGQQSRKSAITEHLRNSEMLIS